MRLFAIMVIDPDSCDEQVHGGRCLGLGLVNDRFLILKRKHRLNGKEHMMLSGRLQNYPALVMPMRSRKQVLASTKPAPATKQIPRRDLDHGDDSAFDARSRAL